MYFLNIATILLLNIYAFKYLYLLELVQHSAAAVVVLILLSSYWNEVMG